MSGEYQSTDIIDLIKQQEARIIELERVITNQPRVPAESSFYAELYPTSSDVYSQPANSSSSVKLGDIYVPDNLNGTIEGLLICRMRRTALASGDGKIQLLIGIDTYRIPLAEARINATLPSANSFNIIGSSSQRLDNTTYSGGWPPVWVVTPIATIIEGGYLTLPGILSLYALFQADAGAASEFFECKFLARVR